MRSTETNVMEDGVASVRVAEGGLDDVPSKIEEARRGEWSGSNINVGPDNCEVDCRKGGLRSRAIGRTRSPRA